MEPLLRLAELAGVRAEYRDAWGAERRVPEETLRAVLAAMGLATEADGLAHAILSLEAESWRALLPPAVVVREGDAVPLALPERLNAGRILWSVSGEDVRRDGGADPRTLDVLASIGEGEHRHRRLAVPMPPLAPGYYALSVAAGFESAETSLIVASSCAYVPPALAEGRRAWGVTAQLHSLRSGSNWGMGDFGDLGALAELAAANGAAVLGINPLHALFPATPRHISPYSPSSRLFLNPLYLDVSAIPDLAESRKAQALLATPDFCSALARARAADLIDHEAVAALKQPIFALLYKSFAAAHLEPGGGAKTARGAEFRRFQAEGAEDLRDYGRFNALSERFGGASWQDWPEPFGRADSDAVRRFAEDHEDSCELHQYLEWETRRQLAMAAVHGGKAGLGIGLYRDLAVGVDPNGAAAWADPGLLVSGATIGAPPDQLNLKGQDWGLAPPSPVALRQRAYAPFIAALRANMRHAGVLRIDHAMALMQLYWVPRGAAPDQGSYVAYPFADLLGIVALESQRNRCAVIGEDLGTVPEGFSRSLNERGILSYRLMMFEREAGARFRPPSHYPRTATATFSSHDLPTLRGFWLGTDLAWRRRLDLYPDAASAERDASERRHDRHRLIEALVAEGLLDAEAARRLLPADDAPVYALELAIALHRFLGRTNAVLALMQLEDAAGEAEQANIPGTTDEHPNWRRRLGRTLEELAQSGDFARLAAALDRKN